MKVLFVASGNSKKFDMSPFIEAQMKSLQDKGVDVDFFPVIGKGLKGYWRSVIKLKAFLKNHEYDIIHAHYTLCGWTAVLARPNTPIVLSLMGSDAYGYYLSRKRPQFLSRYITVLTYVIQPFLNAIISKSENIDKYVYRRKIANVIPNGVRLDQFQIYEHGFHQELGLNPNKKYVLFLGDQSDARKNVKLCEEAIAVLNDSNVELLTPYPISHNDVVKYLWSVDVFVLSAFMEGSPNAVKEAMACNCPIVATEVGDVKWVIGDTEGCYIADFNANDFASKIQMALNFAERKKRTLGRLRLQELGLDADSIAQKIIVLYENILKKKS
ncbi:MAG: glycosyltransferase family 4 protein [Bacteroidota bacterium]